LRWSNDAKNLNDNLKEKALKGYVCGECINRMDCKFKDELPKISRLSVYIMHLFFNASKERSVFEYGEFYHQPDWFIQLWEKCFEYFTSKKDSSKK
jgi:hypothetical protein